MPIVRHGPAPGGRAFIHAAAIALLIACVPMALKAQGLDTEGAIDTIVGSDVTTGQETVAGDEERIVAAIEKTAENVGEVRRRFSIDRVEIVFLPDFGEDETAAEVAMSEHEGHVAELREAIQGSAIFYHAVDSHSVLLGDVVALEFDDDNGVTIFVAGEAPAR